ncbi:hypothetical protein C2S53_015803 [Perilla frutescens var. hirtella]|uniref:NB-ARC domain-containing protein n=1 Tax=Perilla frutescens var. hirtella TaxID=608512 RepID=A0AAD4ISC9_PERFH|nr:hypothetical protein C2S53_015803 [Perilla frutescens var. hirtella]
MAFAAVISLKNTIHRLKNLINKPQMTRSAYEELNSLLSMLKELDKESRRGIDRSVIHELDAKIRDEVWRVEDVLESYYSLIPPSHGLDEKGVEEEMNSFLKTVKILREEYDRALLQNPLPAEEEEDEALSLSAAVPPENKPTTVGLSDLSQSILNQLLRRPYTKLLFSMGLHSDQKRFVVSMVGMAGIGKTHLAALIYHHPLIVQHFHVRLWVRAGPKYQPNNILADILSQLLHKPRDLFKEKSEYTLKDLIGSSLSRTRRYLIVLDDIWTKRVMDSLRRLDLSNTRFLITTRLQEVAEHRSDTERVHRIPFLNNEESWNLLWQNVFVAEKSFPSQLEKPGRKIAEKCEGLPLLILAVANILRGRDKTEEYWIKVAENKNTTFTDAYDSIYEVLLSSYEYLPQHLKSCFLYMGVFRQSCEIRISKLINLWAVEDFLDPTPKNLSTILISFVMTKSHEQMLEEFAIECVEDLVSKSLAIVCEQSFYSFFREVRKIKSSKLHSAYWYLCVKEARKSKFLHVLNKLTDVSKDYIEKQRRLSIQNNILLGIKEVYDTMAAAISTTRSILCTGEDHQYPVPICFNTMLLMRVLDALAIRFYEFPNEVLKLLQLRYLSLTHNGELPSSISKLQQLQCLILRRHHNIKFLTAPKTYLPDEIWDMKELRHLRITGSNLADPSKGKDLSKLLTLYVNAHSCSKAVFRGIPYLKKLGITIELEPDAAAETVRCLEHIKLLHRLQSLKCVVVNPRLGSQLAVAPPDHLSNLPQSLKKLSLNGLGYSWKDMTAIGSLPNLKVLKLRCSAFQGAKWETEARQFESLEFLLLEDIDLVHWTYKYNYFPKLRHVSVRHCYKLKKIPLEIGFIRSLEMMEVDDCSPSVVAYAHHMSKAKYYHLQVVINSSWNL